MVEVENIITALIVPISFIPLKKRYREHANPPKLNAIKKGI